jgi:hypothetical protein
MPDGNGHADDQVTVYNLRPPRSPYRVMQQQGRSDAEDRTNRQIDQVEKIRAERQANKPLHPDDHAKVLETAKDADFERRWREAGNTVRQQAENAPMDEQFSKQATLSLRPPLQSQNQREPSHIQVDPEALKKPERPDANRRGGLVAPSPAGTTSTAPTRQKADREQDDAAQGRKSQDATEKTDGWVIRTSRISVMQRTDATGQEKGNQQRRLGYGRDG